MNFSANETLFLSIEKINSSNYNACFVVPPKIVSDGLWGGQVNGRTPLKSSLPIFELQVVLIFVVTQIFQFFLKRFHFPQFIPQMIAGLILGTAIQVEALDKYKKLIFPFPSQDTLATIASIGYALYIFISGVQMDLSMVTRTGRKAWTIAITGLVVPLIICIPTLNNFLGDHKSLIGHHVYGASAVVISETVISFAVVASLLNELKIINSELGRLALSSVLVSDILSKTISCFSRVAAMESLGKNEMIVMWISLIAFGIFVPLIFRPAMFWIIKHTKEGRPVDDGYVYLIISMVFVLGWIAVRINQEFVLGAFILGLAVPEGPPLGSALVKKLQFFGNSFLLPIHVTCSVMKADFSLHYSSELVIAMGSIILFTHLIKVIACVIPAFFCKIPFKEALVLALIVNVRGVVEIGLYIMLYDEGVINGHAYGILMISIMIIACLVKLSVKLLYDPSRKYAGYQKRNIMNLKPDSELRIVACLHKTYQISAMKDVLDLCGPTTEHPIIVEALHLIELVGRTSPIFISNHIHREVSSSHKSYSDDVILGFDLYEHDNIGAVTANTYTAISPPSLMHEDVCQLALDRVASIVILPFHIRWSSDGGIESDDKNVRVLNSKVLEIAPCSIGILVSPSSIQGKSFIRLAMIFLGGRDDREALCLAKRATRNAKVNLVVYHLAPKDNLPNMDYALDNEVLKDITNPQSNMPNISYHRVIVNDGPETSSVLCRIVDEHDFFIVGRRHELDSPQTKGLSEWTEFPELGAIGDLLASSDFESKVGVLVVQQQARETNSGWKIK